ncbi:MAG TPA: putative RNA uridine N3 methyltransferase [archaeon]|nr:putative RNA uridine N3 methyltransferase [archaeon]
MQEKTLVIPSTFTADEKNAYVKAYKVGEAARAATCFGYSRVLVYFDKDPRFNSRKLAAWIEKTLNYCNTPPYLRKNLFKKDPALRYAGIIPPIAGPHHQPEKFGLPYRYGAVHDVSPKGLKVYAGLDDYVLVPDYPAGVKKNDVVIVNTVDSQLVDKESLEGRGVYFGFGVENNPGELESVLRELKKDSFKVLAATRKGESLDGERLRGVASQEKLAVVFGSAYRGVLDLLKDSRELLDYAWNSVPSQNSLTVRTEEAIYYSLAVLNYCSSKKPRQG